MDGTAAGGQIVAGTAKKAAFASNRFPADLDDRARFRFWQDNWNALYGAIDLVRPDDRPFSAQLEFAPFGQLGVGRLSGTINRMARRRQAVAADGADNFFLCLPHGRFGAITAQHGRETGLDHVGAVLLTNAEPGEIRAKAEMGWIGINVSRRQVLDLVAGAEDLIGAPLHPESEALRHLRRYAGMLLEPGAIGNDPALIAHISAGLLDLIALAIGAGRDMAEVARLRGLRAARLHEVLAAIKARFADPSISSEAIGRGLGLSRRYVNDLLFETGQSLSERVLELRVQKARAMLTDPRNDRMKVSEIALACGFNEVSYFNRCFRRRFGASPTQYRGDGK